MPKLIQLPLVQGQTHKTLIMHLGNIFSVSSSVITTDILLIELLKSRKENTSMCRNTTLTKYDKNTHNTYNSHFCN